MRQGRPAEYPMREPLFPAPESGRSGDAADDYLCPRPRAQVFRRGGGASGAAQTGTLSSMQSADGLYEAIKEAKVSNILFVDQIRIITSDPADCDNRAAAINPAVNEGPPGAATCSDLVDNNCDGRIDVNDANCR
jgi:hypothetical protein